jgi:hypothetical protein
LAHEPAFFAPRRASFTGRCASHRAGAGRLPGPVSSTNEAHLSFLHRRRPRGRPREVPRGRRARTEASSGSRRVPRRRQCERARGQESSFCTVRPGRMGKDHGRPQEPNPPVEYLARHRQRDAWSPRMGDRRMPRRRLQLFLSRQRGRHSSGMRPDQGPRGHDDGVLLRLPRRSTRLPRGECAGHRGDGEQRRPVSRGIDLCEWCHVVGRRRVHACGPHVRSWLRPGAQRNQCGWRPRHPGIGPRANLRRGTRCGGFGVESCRRGCPAEGARSVALLRPYARMSSGHSISSSDGNDLPLHPCGKAACSGQRPHTSLCAW